MMGPTTIANPSKDDLDLNALVADRDRPCLFPIEYAYDYMKNAHRYLTGPPSTVDFPLREKIRRNSIPLNPFLAKVPWYSGLTTLRQNKYWKINISRTTELLNLFAEDVSFNSAQNTNGRALANFARKELKTRSFDRYSRFTSYMFPDADEHRTALLAQAIVLIVIFDGKQPYVHLPASILTIPCRHVGGSSSWICMYTINRVFVPDRSGLTR